jgi:hypothetical protein
VRTARSLHRVRRRLPLRGRRQGDGQVHPPGPGLRGHLRHHRACHLAPDRVRRERDARAARGLHRRMPGLRRRLRGARQAGHGALRRPR